MGFIGGLFSGSRGVGFEPEQTYGQGQALQQMQQVQESLANQRKFAEALQQQSPQAIRQQMMLGQQLAGAVKGQGPSVAQAQLAQTTGQNIAQQAALLGGQRGASANVGRLGANVAQMGGQLQQQAAGQAATLRAQEQLAAMQQLQGLTGQQLQQISGAQGMGLQGELQAQQNVLNAIAEANRVRGGIAQQTAAGQAGIVGGLLGAGAAAAAGGKAEGGLIESPQDESEEGDSFFTSFAKNMAQTQPQAQDQSYQSGYQAGQAIGKLAGKTISSLFKKGPSGQSTGGYSGANLGVNASMPKPVNPMATSANIGALNMGFSQGGKVPAMVSPGEKYLPPSEVKKVALGQKSPLSAGRTIPGKAKVSGDSYANDTVPANLEEGGIVIPRSVMQSKNPAEQARKFVAAVLAKKQAKR